eukprot:TRINITY_DN38121_c0_g1_i1.p1 TRINITY_DN38121_c0_g1~~TRINITY_DN38121_c0_g1_i1.p1  ORF type:complete len:346 (-),score=34.35 TRINITY_DN38121_c0_g1_i1:156-1193(-)
MVDATSLQVPSPAKPSTVLVIGLGNVGRGIADAFAKTKAWHVVAVDPVSDLGSLEGGSHRLLTCTVDDLPDSVLSDCHEIVYAAECGNRDEYAVCPELSAANVARFTRFAERCARCANGPRHIAYVGGSWTRRDVVVQADGTPLVCDENPEKDASTCNPYEKAKTTAHAHARDLSRKLAISITFYDWCSVVPNYAPNFSVNKMIAQALECGQIRYSAGDFGRPLMSSSDAGRALVTLTMARLTSRLKSSSNTDSMLEQPTFETILLPGVFVHFQRFAEIVSEEVESKCKCSRPELIAEDGSPPETLRARCNSTRLEAMGFIPDNCAVEEGLRATCREALRSKAVS